MKNLPQWLVQRISNFLKRDDGPTAVEYAVMLMLIVIVCLASITTLGKNTNGAFSYVGSSIKAAE
jgi:pilus assembly protein Flp/PilA